MKKERADRVRDIVARSIEARGYEASSSGACEKNTTKKTEGGGEHENPVPRN